jgi:hypothetical protein
MKKKELKQGEKVSIYVRQRDLRRKRSSSKESSCSSEFDHVVDVVVLDQIKPAGLTKVQPCCSQKKDAIEWLDDDKFEAVKKITNYQEEFNVESIVGPLLFYESSTCGRFCVAKTNIKQGTTALSATAFALIVKQKLVRKMCHWCFQPLRKKAFQCNDCKFALYCSKKCLQDDSILHDFQCFTLNQLKDITSISLDKDLIRLALGILSMENLIHSTRALEKLKTHPLEPSQELEIQRASHFVATNLSCTFPLNHIIHVFKCVQFNAHPLMMDSNMTCGLGMFPEAAMTLNHSCSPNVCPTFDPKKRTLNFQAIVSITQTQVIEYAYIDLFQTKRQRQELLFNGFKFHCSCIRCVNSMDQVFNKEEQEKNIAHQQLMQLKTLQELERFAQHKILIESNELAFTYHMIVLTKAFSSKQWQLVEDQIQHLLILWREEMLPECYPVIDLFYQQLEMALQAQQKFTQLNKIQTKRKQIHQFLYPTYSP